MRNKIIKCPHCECNNLYQEIYSDTYLNNNHRLIGKYCENCHTFEPVADLKIIGWECVDRELYPNGIGRIGIIDYPTDEKDWTDIQGANVGTPSNLGRETE